jgi:hypothetical protein
VNRKYIGIGLFIFSLVCLLSIPLVTFLGFTLRQKGIAISTLIILGEISFWSSTLFGGKLIWDKIKDNFKRAQAQKEEIEEPLDENA